MTFKDDSAPPDPLESGDSEALDAMRLETIRHAVGRLVGIMATLRSEKGCPWDREQTHETLKKYAVEEVYELLEAIEAGGTAEIVEELGDLLLQVVFHAQLAAERGEFTLKDVADGISEKLIERHPHVFGDVTVSGVAEVIANWEEIKKRSKGAGGETAAEKPRGLFDGVPKSLPALLMAYRIVEKSGGGFAEPSAPSAAQENLRASIRANALDAGSLPDLLRDAAHLCALAGIDPEEALRERNRAWMDEIVKRRDSIRPPSGRSAK
jgi:tetrapyrrole methylase family protein / MazG family protein